MHKLCSVPWTKGSHCHFKNSLEQYSIKNTENIKTNFSCVVEWSSAGRYQYLSFPLRPRMNVQCASRPFPYIVSHSKKGFLEAHKPLVYCAPFEPCTEIATQYANIRRFVNNKASPYSRTASYDRKLRACVYYTDLLSSLSCAVSRYTTAAKVMGELKGLECCLEPPLSR